MVCAGYVYMEDLPDLTLDEHAADEGTAAGEYLENLLTKKPMGDTAANGVFFDDDMKFHATNVYNHIMSRTSEQVLCETRIDWQTRSGIWIKGQYDAAFVDNNGVLCIEDLKYGYGIIEVEQNWQLLGYAIGECIRRGKAFEKISLKIHQPRPHHEDGEHREWLLTYAELLEQKEKIEDRMQEIVNGRRDLQTSSACRYCEAAPEACPAFSRLFYRALEVTTEFVQDSLTDEELARQLDQVKRAEEVIKIKKDSLTELGVSRIKEGKIIPGYVQTNKYSNRTWKSGISPESIKVMTGIDPVETKFMTPAKVEKMGVDKTLVKQLVEKRFVGVKLEKKDSSKIGNKIFGNEKPQGGN